VLDRLMADLPVRAPDITALGVGGLLMEIGSRPQPREEARPAGRTAARRREIAGLLLAAGRSSRAEGTNKLLARLDGVPLVRRVAEQALESGLSRLVVVTGHMQGAIRDALAGLDTDIVHNPDFAEGMGSSIRTGMQALPQSAEAVMVLLGDMPGIDAAAIDRLISAYRPEAGRAIIAAAHEGERGNPVLFDRLFFAGLSRLEGDSGARRILAEHAGLVTEVEIGSAARHDLDTREALAAAGAEIAGPPSAKD
jgi:molybdenum cofactor cytidylyltransferase